VQTESGDDKTRAFSARRTEKIGILRVSIEGKAEHWFRAGR
jgi:hypothetical protein